MTFEELIPALGAKLDIELSVLEGACALEVDGNAVILQEVGELLLFHADLGTPPPQSLEKLYRALLEANYLYQGTGGATLAVNPQGGHIHLQKYEWLVRLDAEQAVEALERFVDTLIAWKHIIEDYRPEIIATPPENIEPSDFSGTFLQV